MPPGSVSADIVALAAEHSNRKSARFLQATRLSSVCDLRLFLDHPPSTMDPDDLRRFLVSLPSKLGYTDNDALEQCLFKALYYAATAEGKYLRHLFPLIIQDQIDELENYEFPLSLHERRPFYTVKSPEKYSHPKGRACARTFKKGDPVFQCQDCSYDETCVLCVDCFNPSDHQDHSVFSYYSRGISSGMCDCGDPEAFVVPLNCKCQTDSLELENIPPDFEQSLRLTIQICLDYILDVTNFSIQTLPFIHDHIDTPGSPLTSLRLSNYSSLPSGRYGGAVDTNSSNLWYLVLWNDENHTVDQALQAILAATKLAKPRAQALTQIISEQGKAIILEKSSYSELLVPLRNAQLNGLVATICSARDYMKESMVEIVFAWLQSLAEGNTLLSSMSSKIIAELLLQPNHQLSKVVPAEFIKGLSIDDRRRCFENGLLYDGKFVNAGLCEVSPYDNLSQLYKPAHLVLTKSPKLDRPQSSRLQFLLAFEIRFSTKVRRQLGMFLVSHLIVDIPSKRAFSDQYIELYPQLITTMCLSDREEELNSMSHISAQLLTCPATVLYILQKDQLSTIMGPVARLIEEHSAIWNYDSGYPNLVDITNDKPHTYRSIVLAIQRGIDDIRHIIDKSVKSSLHSFFTHKNTVILLMFLRNFQGYWALERKYGDHVEIEQMDFIVHRLYSTPVLDIVQTLASADTDIKVAQDATKLIIDFLLLRQVKKNAPGIPDFVVSKEPVSFINPINSLLSYMLQRHGFQNFESLLSSIRTPFVNISDISLRSIVLAAQINIGFWIRNGFSVARQGSVYSNSSISDSTYHRDFHLNQIAAILDDPRATLYNFLDRWELLDWYVNKVSHEETVYEERFSAIGEKFLIFLYNLIIDRSRFLTLTYNEWYLNQTRQEICYELCDGPKAYSYLKSSVSADASKHECFDDILEECAEYQPPTGLTDSGRYKLKESMYEHLDPMSILMDGSKYQDVADALAKQISKSKGIKEADVILMPKNKPSGNSFVDNRIGRFAKTTDFAKLIYKFMRASIDSSEEFYIMPVLHLLHAVISDDEYLNGPEYLNSSFVSIPIGDLLMSLVNSSMSPHVRKKADYLLGLFLARDSRVMDSLIDCFGEEYMSKYMEHKNELIKFDNSKKRSLAEKRKAKVMKKFAKQRQQFLQRSDFKEDQLPVEGGSAEQARTCILCGEPESTSDVFGILGSNTESSVFWKLPEKGPLVADAFADFDDIINATLTSYGYGYTYPKSTTSLNNHKECKLVFSTCGHGMHYRCFKRSANRSLHINCPLCQSYQNTFLPTYITPSDATVPENIMSDAPLTLSYNEILESESHEKAKALLTAFMLPDYFQPNSETLRPLEEGLMARIKSLHNLRFDTSRSSAFDGDSLSRLSGVIGDTIRMHEITTRIEGNCSYTDFLDLVPMLAKLLVRSLIQSRVYLGTIRDNDPEPHRNAFDPLDSDTMADSTFNETVRLFFQTDESFQTLSKLGFTKTVGITVYSLVQRILEGKFSVPIFNRVLDEGSINDVKVLLHGLCDTASLPHLDLKDNRYVSNFFYAIERLVLPYLRQVIVFFDILTSRYDAATSTFVSLQATESLKDLLISLERPDNSDVLCDMLGVPRLHELIKTLVERSEKGSFELRIYDNIICAKIPRHLDDGILTLEYPGVVKLINLPEDFNSFTPHESGGTREQDTLICLVCGTDVGTESQQVHAKDCCRHAVYFQPRLNFLRISTRIGKVPVGYGLPAPYLTSHGEIKKVLMRGRAKLNHLRYRHLNKLWLNLGLYGYVTRTLTENELNLETLETLEAGEGFRRGFLPV